MKKWKHDFVSSRLASSSGSSEVASVLVLCQQQSQSRLLGVVVARRVQCRRVVSFAPPRAGCVGGRGVLHCGASKLRSESSLPGGNAPVVASCAGLKSCSSKDKLLGGWLQEAGTRWQVSPLADEAISDGPTTDHQPPTRPLTRPDSAQVSTILPFVLPPQASAIHPVTRRKPTGR